MNAQYLPEDYPCPKYGNESVTSILDENGLAETSCGSCGERIYPNTKEEYPHRVDCRMAIRTLCPKEGCEFSHNKRVYLWKDGNCFGQVSFLRGQRIVKEQEKKGCKVIQGDNIIVIMSPRWKPKPPLLQDLGELKFIKSIDEFE